MSHSDNVIRMPVSSTSFTPKQALLTVLNDDLSDVIIVGYDKDGDLIIRSSKLTRAEALFLLTKASRWAEGSGSNE